MATWIQGHYGILKFQHENHINFQITILYNLLWCHNLVSYLFAESHGGLWKSYTETKYPFWHSADSSESHAFSSIQSSIWCWLIASAVWH